MRRWAARAMFLGLIASTSSMCFASVRTHSPLQAASPRRTTVRPAAHANPLRHIVIVIQENRSLDNLLNGFCLPHGECANTVPADPVTLQPLLPESLAAPYSPDHSHSEFVVEYDGGKMDGFSKDIIVCNGNKQPCPYSAFAYVPSFETIPYRQMATVDGVLSDETFQPNSGPSLPAHLYAIGGQSGGYDSDRWAIALGSGNCATTQPVARQILMSSPYPGKEGNPVPPCKDFQTIFDLLANAGYSWRYYTDSNSGWWAGPENIQHLYGSSNITLSSHAFLSDAASGKLADVSFVMPPANSSDHPGFDSNPSFGPNWVASIVNAIGQSAYWKTTAIVIYWDDWGGWFDHVVPPAAPVNPDPFEYGFRVPLIVVSPYAKIGRIDHTARTFVSSLRLIEETFGLPSLGTIDQYEPDGLDSMFNFQRRIKFTPIPAACVPCASGSNASPMR